MFTVLLVEDEKLELETLRDYVNWYKLGIEKVYTARNGRRALELIEDYNPDIIITDIHMPVMNGLELAKRIREDGYLTKIVFLSGYDDFDYVKSAFQVEAVDYILKPFLTEEVESLILKICETLKKEKIEEVSIKLAEGHLLERACNTSPNDTLEMKKYFEIPSNEKEFGLLALYALEHKEIYETCINLPEVKHVFFSQDIYFIVLRGYLSFQDFSKRISKALEHRYSILYCKDKIPIEKLSEKAELLKSLKEYIFFCPSGEIDAAEALQEKTMLPEKNKLLDYSLLHTKIEELLKYITANKQEQAFYVLEEYMKILFSLPRSECKKEAYSFYLYVNSQLVMGDSHALNWMKEWEEKDTVSILSSIYFKEIKDKLTQYIQHLINYYKKQLEDPNSYAVNWVKDYLENNYSGICSVDEMASGINLSPNYLRSLFKAGTGKTILEYITDYRLEKACELLKNKTLKIKDISAQVGYENISYFSQVFIKRYGVAPNEYRKMV